MATETPTPASVAAPPPKEPQSITRTLTDGRNQLQFVGIFRKDGSVSTYVLHRELDEKGKQVKSTRGASNSYPNKASALEAINAGIKVAVKAGWQERKGGGGRGGFKARADEFDLNHLPKPAGK